MTYHGFQEASVRYFWRTSGWILMKVSSSTHGWHWGAFKQSMFLPVKKMPNLASSCYARIHGALINTPQSIATTMNTFSDEKGIWLAHVACVDMLWFVFGMMKCTTCFYNTLLNVEILLWKIESFKVMKEWMLNCIISEASQSWCPVTKTQQKIKIKKKENI